MKKPVIFALALVAAFTSCDEYEEVAEINIERRDIPMTQSEEQLASGQVSFGIDVFRAMSQKRDPMLGNLIVGPYSLSTLLAMTANGADGEALTEICNVLGVNEGNIEDLNNWYGKLYKELPTLDNRVSFVGSNSIWTLPDNNFKTEFSTVVGANYGAEVCHADFGTLSGINLVNEWCSRKTNGMIKSIYNGPSPLLETVLISATCFDGKWTAPFKEENTRKAVFHGERGETTVDMMTTDITLKFYMDDKMLIARVPYGNKAYNMHIVLPVENSNGSSQYLDEFIKEFTPAIWNKAKSELKRPVLVHLSMPRFKVESDNVMTDALRAMGLNEIFDNPASLPGVLQDGKRACLNEIKNKVIIETRESGTKVADVSYGYVTTSPVFDGSLTLDRPFMYIIDEVSTGTILYIGAIYDL